MIEKFLLGHIITKLVDNGFRVQISDRDGGGLYVYAIPNGLNFPTQKGKINHWVKLVPGNGCDFISDYSTNLQNYLESVFKIAAVCEEIEE